VQIVSFSTFGDWFFGTIEFCLYANSLQLLTAISYTPRLVGLCEMLPLLLMMLGLSIQSTIPN
jgi:hypothetical protein